MIISIVSSFWVVGDMRIEPITPIFYGMTIVLVGCWVWSRLVMLDVGAVVALTFATVVGVGILFAFSDNFS